MTYPTKIRAVLSDKSFAADVPAPRPALKSTSTAPIPSRSGVPIWRRSVTAFARNRSAVAGLVVLVAVAVLAVLAPVLYPGDPLDMAGPSFVWPGQSLDFPLGTDSLGRNVAAGIAHGARISLVVGAWAAGLGLLVGIVVGAVAGYFGGWIDDLSMRVVELFQTIPPFLLVIVLVAIWQPSIFTITAAIGIVSWPQVARLVRAEFRSLRQKDFVMAARGLGFGHGRIIVREILPNAMPPIVVTASVMVATAILMESALSFLGLGDANRVSWGSMIGSGRDVLRTAWFLTAVPGSMIVLTVLSLNLVGDGLNEALNPRRDGEV